jgi:hypothetical protein
VTEKRRRVNFILDRPDESVLFPRRCDAAISSSRCISSSSAESYSLGMPRCCATAQTRQLSSGVFMQINLISKSDFDAKFRSGSSRTSREFLTCAECCNAEFTTRLCRLADKSPRANNSIRKLSSSSGAPRLLHAAAVSAAIRQMSDRAEQESSA